MRVIQLRVSILCVALSGLATACAHGPEAPPVDVGGVALNPDPWLEDRADIMRRATFDLSCPEEGVSLVILETGSASHERIPWDDWAVEVGASGCDGQATYLRTDGGWTRKPERVLVTE